MLCYSFYYQATNACCANLFLRLGLFSANCHLGPHAQTLYYIPTAPRALHRITQTEFHPSLFSKIISSHLPPINMCYAPRRQDLVRSKLISASTWHAVTLGGEIITFPDNILIYLYLGPIGISQYRRDLNSNHRTMCDMGPKLPHSRERAKSTAKERCAVLRKTLNSKHCNKRQLRRQSARPNH